MPKSKKDQSKTSSQPSQSHQSKPNWPLLRPLIPPSSLYLDPTLPDQIYTIRNFLTATLCKNYVSFLASLPLITTPGKPKKGDAVRVNDRFQIEDATFAEMLWSSTALRELVTQGEEGDVWGGEPVGLNSNIRVYRYSKGQFFAKHYDDSNALTFKPPQSNPMPARTTWTLLIYLTTCGGGETVFYQDPTRENRNPEPISVAPEIGMALLHRHGERCLMHEGMEVTEGEKWVLRSDLVVKR
ncbi:hypothetical protein ASPWEDRAFT_168989 [Aspergillus wentii DTO 134E9]|uniref:Fe2OG dioxygenase domain-containing protein n=1 Tax=Aspergillus wentii DTO 134E9 TaxID=1073089 RepID=A0A1L9RWA5_ASPWE|nr:uncharacterized protein ASPWEDRAFT_168989 [Aspergillus wentii DTO 134E9]KAI9929173.1 hypothetical protein MW887_001577 [Aspergillus wentii]OJJ39128.1 hypothetical protein ASPWEDRAFT_168989 [Aspergillus wentii DTO 134E9]